MEHAVRLNNLKAVTINLDVRLANGIGSQVSSKSKLSTDSKNPRVTAPRAHSNMGYRSGCPAAAAASFLLLQAALAISNN
jgi:hypothetical protein